MFHLALKTKHVADGVSCIRSCPSWINWTLCGDMPILVVFSHRHESHFRLWNETGRFLKSRHKTNSIPCFVERNWCFPSVYTCFGRMAQISLPWKYKNFSLKFKISQTLFLSPFLHYYPLDNINPLTPELNPSAQRCLTRYFTGDFASWTVNFFNICLKNQQMQQLFIKFINYVW
jgi:hypothetical protein